jgi:hypothetical protein
MKKKSNVLLEVRDGDVTRRVLKEPIGKGTAYGSSKDRYVTYRELPLKPRELAALAEINARRAAGKRK